MDSCLGANGAIYALRRELFWKQIPDNTIVDDFVIGMKVREQGRRMVYEPAAVAEEELPAAAHEWTRRARIGAGDYQALVFCRRCLSPRYGRFAWMFWSHKVLRWFTPHIMLLALGLAGWGAWSAERGTGNAGLGDASLVSLAVLAGAAAFLLMALAGCSARRPGWARTAVGRAPGLCDHFLTMQAALFAGFLRFCRGNLKGQWKRTPRG